MSIAGAFSRSVLRSTSIRKAAARVVTTSEAKAKAKTSSSSSSSSPFRLSNNQKPLSHRIFKSPVELSCCVDSLMPFHSANSSAILISNLGVSLRAYTWLLQEFYVQNSGILRATVDELRSIDCPGRQLLTFYELFEP